MRITLLQGGFLPVPAIMGGAVEKIWFEMGKQFAARGNDVTQISRAHLDLPDHEEIENVKHIRVPGHNAPASMVGMKCLDLLYTLRAIRVLPKADIIVTHTFWAPLLLKPRHGRIYVSVDRLPKGQIRLYRNAARFRVPSKSAAKAVCRGIPAADHYKVKVVPNPLTSGIERLNPIHSHRQPVLLYVGRVHPEKGLHLLLQAFAEAKSAGWLQGWKLRLAGSWEPHHGGGGLKWWNQLIKKWADPQIEWLGPVYDVTKLLRLYEESSIFVYPSLAERGETFGHAALEAMSAGLPVILSKLDCFSDLIANGRTGLSFDHRDSEASSLLRSRIQSLVQDKSLRETMGQAARIRSRDYFASQIAQMFLDDFSALLTSPS